MLINFTFENWMSFRDATLFSMVAGRERRHRARVPKLENYKTSVLPTAAIYGGNASGKSNFFAALSFVKDFVVQGTEAGDPIDVQPYLLNDTQPSRPSSFSFEVLANKTIYEYNFTVTYEKVIAEQLIEIRNTSKKTLFNRQNNKLYLHNDIPKKQNLELIFDNTRNNQLFITNTVDQNQDIFIAVYDWFRKTLVMIYPDTQYGTFDDLTKEDSINSLLRQLDTGIERLNVETVELDDIPIPNKALKQFGTFLEEGKYISLSSPTEGHYLLSREDNILTVKRLSTIHKQENGTETRFELSQESDGSRRLVDILPAIVGLLNRKTPQVVFIDEFDRSLHTLLLEDILERYLENCSPETRSQLIFTTHNVQVLDQELFRRDEMWLTKRNDIGATRLFSVGDFKDIRADRDIRKSYLLGQLDGIPTILRTDSTIPIEAPYESWR